ncbi:MAG TPA: DUF3805 domain-containing protein [Bacteroidaceae bacterium]|mgnify:CR=1 FL=1|nr:DUF3805 domain-containing protein [Bacteroidaceae bacterium]
MSHSKRFIAPGGWFSMSYPESWFESEDTPDSFLFYNPNIWSGNFRVSVYREEKNMHYGKDAVDEFIREEKIAHKVQVGQHTAAYLAYPVEEDGNEYTMHIWVVDLEHLAAECTFICPQGGEIADAVEVIESLEPRYNHKKYPAELIPPRIAEISIVNEAYNMMSHLVNDQTKKNFQGSDEDIAILIDALEQADYSAKKREVWLAVGITLCVILAEEVEGLEWRTLIDGNREDPVLYYLAKDLVIDPMKLVWSKKKHKLDCDLMIIYQECLTLLSGNE